MVHCGLRSLLRAPLSDLEPTLPAAIGIGSAPISALRESAIFTRLVCHPCGIDISVNFLFDESFSLLLGLDSVGTAWVIVDGGTVQADRAG